MESAPVSHLVPVTWHQNSLELRGSENPNQLVVERHVRHFLLRPNAGQRLGRASDFSTDPRWNRISCSFSPVGKETMDDPLFSSPQERDSGTMTARFHPDPSPAVKFGYRRVDGG